MSYIDKHIAYSNIEGKTIVEQQFNSSADFINSVFTESPFYIVGKWNNTDLEMQLNDVTSITRSNQIMPVQYGIKFARFKPNTVVNIGEIIEIPNEDNSEYIPWMVVDFTSENKLFPKAKIGICNFELNVKTSETTPIFVGNDKHGAPVYRSDSIYTPLQAILKNTIGNISLNSEINIPSERMLITINYDDTGKTIKENDTFDLYGREYKVVGIDFSNVFYGVGCITLITERVVNQ